MYDPQVIIAIINTVVLIIFALASSIKTLVEKGKRTETTSSVDVKLDNIMERVSKIEETLAQEKIIESMQHMAEIQKSTIKILKDLRNGEQG